tara:strand:- start:1110 stop:1229 length:120 start_codon:yes stop_codon:yes gene_type:complete
MNKRKTFYVLLACFVGGFSLTVALYYALLALAAHLSINA